jgi:hypothetical protein
LSASAGAQATEGLLPALEALIGDSGEILSEYGGFIIYIKQPQRFPWYQVAQLLLKASMEVWISEKAGACVIRCKPEPA